MTVHLIATETMVRLNTPRHPTTPGKRTFFNLMVDSGPLKDAEGVLSNFIHYILIILSLGDGPIDVTRASIGSYQKGLWATCI